MKEFLKDYFLCYFSHTRAKNIYKRSFLITFINVFALLLSMFLASFLSQEVSFKYFYNRCDSLKETLNEVLKNDTLIKDDKLSTSFIYDSFKNDDNHYVDKGFYVVVDTRDKSTTFDNFSFVMANTSNEKISYEEYLLLPDNQKEQYSPIITRSGEYLDTISNISKYEIYLSSQQDKTKFEEIKNKYESGEISQLDYANKIYVLYGKSYYPEDVYTCDSFGGLPTLRSYYLASINSLGVKQGFIFIYEEGLEACFVQDNKTISFYGDYRTCNGLDFSGGNISTVETLVSNLYKSSRSLRAVAHLFVSFFAWFIALIVLIVLVFVTRFILSIVHKDERHYTIKIMNLIGSFILFSSVISMIAFIFLGFVLSRSVIIIACPLAIIAFVAIRTLIYYLIEKHPSDVIEEKEEVKQD